MKRYTVIFKFDINHEITTYTQATNDADAIREAFASCTYGQNYGTGTATVFCEDSSIAIRYNICAL